MRRRLLAVGALGAVLGTRALAQGVPMASRPAAAELAQSATAARARGAPLVLFFTTPGCPYCREVRASYLAPRVAQGTVVYEVDITSQAPLTGLDGRATTPAALAERYGIAMVPVVLPVDARGEPLAEPVVGLDRAGFYEARLQAALDAAQKRLPR